MIDVFTLKYMKFEKNYSNKKMKVSLTELCNLNFYMLIYPIPNTRAPTRVVLNAASALHSLHPKYANVCVHICRCIVCLCHFN